MPVQKRPETIKSYCEQGVQCPYYDLPDRVICGDYRVAIELSGVDEDKRSLGIVGCPMVVFESDDSYGVTEKGLGSNA
jgi:hypothetical protein